MKGVRFPAIINEVKHARHLFTIWVDAGIREEIIFKLQDKGIGVAVNYRPIHLMKYYVEKYGYTPGILKNAERIGNETISLPIYPKLLDQEVEYVCDSLSQILDELS